MSSMACPRHRELVRTMGNNKKDVVHNGDAQARVRDERKDKQEGTGLSTREGDIYRKVRQVDNDGYQLVINKKKLKGG